MRDSLEFDDAGVPIVPTSPGASSSGVGVWSSLEKDGHLQRLVMDAEELMLLEAALAASTSEVSSPHLYWVGQHATLLCIA